MGASLLIAYHVPFDSASTGDMQVISSGTVLIEPSVAMIGASSMHPAALERLIVPNRKPRRPKTEKPEQEFPNVAQALRAIRKAHGLTQEAMAPILTLSFAGYRPYERGERDLTQSQIEVIATALRVPVSEITRHLWPKDPLLIETHYSHEWEDIQRQTEELPEEIRERTLRGFKESLAVLQAASDLARRN